jgi:hypothetical protein
MRATRGGSITQPNQFIPKCNAWCHSKFEVVIKKSSKPYKTTQFRQWQWNKFVWTLCTTNSATADNRGRKGERKRERESKQASHPLMYLLSPPNEQIHPFKSPQVAHLMWSELLMEGSNFHHLTQHTHNQSQMVTLDATACLVNWHRRIFKTLETSEFRSDSDTTTVWALHTTLSAIPVNRGRERERGEVGGSEINVPSFLPSFQRQARMYNCVSQRGSGESTRLRRLKVARQMMRFFLSKCKGGERRGEERRGRRARQSMDFSLRRLPGSLWILTTAYSSFSSLSPSL